MTILLTGATGYIGKRLLPVLVAQGHEIICCVRDKSGFDYNQEWTNVSVFEVDFLKKVNIEEAPLDFDVAYYLIHSMSASIGNFEDKEAKAASNFVDYINESSARQIIYLTGMANSDDLSPHLRSRLKVEEILGSGDAALTALRAGIIIGSGSASFEIIRDLVEKLPIMITPKWIKTRCQPIAIRNVIEFLTGVLLCEDCYDQNYDIGCRDILTYREMLLGYAKVRGLKRYIYTTPVMSPRFSSFWLNFVTSISYPLAVNLVDSMKVDVVSRDFRLAEMLDIDLIPYHEAIELAFQDIKQNMVVSSWKDSLISSVSAEDIHQFVEVPTNGTYSDIQTLTIAKEDVPRVWKNILSIGGVRGWYYGNPLWKIRGFMDKLVGGVGLGRGRTHSDQLHTGDALDFWRVLIADTEQYRLLLYAEMKLPGEAWLEFDIDPVEGDPNQYQLRQTATFRPDGLAGRLYWYSVLPFHYFIFGGMIRNLAKYQEAAS